MSDLPVFAPLPAPVGEVEPLPLPPTLDEVRQLMAANGLALDMSESRLDCHERPGFLGRALMS